MRRAIAALALLCLALPALTSCGDDEPTGTDTPSPTGSTPVTVDITIEGGEVTPNGERVDVEVGQPIELVVNADEAGELHVHSQPEQELTYGAGTTTLKLTLDQPGVVDVEAHELEVVIVQLEVR